MMLSSHALPKASAALRTLTLAGSASLLVLGAPLAQDARGDALDEALRQPATDRVEDPALSALRSLIAEGELTQEAARKLYLALQPADSPVLRQLEPLYTQVATKVDEGVASGRLSKEEGELKKATLATTLREMGFYIEVLERPADEARILVAVDQGRLDPEEAEAMLAELRRDPSLDWMARPLVQHGVPRERVAEVLAAAELVVREMRAEGQEFALDPEQHDHLVALGLTGEQIELVLGMSKRAVEAPPTLRSAYDDWIVGALAEAGVPREALRDASGAARKIARQMLSQDSPYRMDGEMHGHLSTLGLSGEQIGLVEELAQRAAKREIAQKRRAASDRKTLLASYAERIRDAVEAGEMTEAEGEEALKEMKAQLFAAKAHDRRPL